MSKLHTRDPLAPLDAITSIIQTVLITAVLFFAVALAVDHNGVSFLGIGESDVCVTSHNGFASVSGDEPSKLDRADDGLRQNTRLFPSAVDLCDDHPSIGAKILYVLIQAPTTLVFFGFVFLTRRTIRYAQKHGLFSRALAARIERLGWLLVLGLVVAALVEWLSKSLLLSTMTTHAGWASGSFGISVPGIIGAYGLVSIGRVMGHAAALQADSDATI
ncbi:MAG: hypothetical protein JWR83_2909 [Aeromicrobium sp.]|nr:hypothetical protein [Aeromicrobium sp.]